MKNSLEISNSHAHEWPALRLGLAAEIAALAAELEQTQWYSRKQLEANQMRQLRQLLTFVVKHSAFYGEVFASSGVKLADLAAIDGLQNLPLLRRQRIQGAGDDFFCREVPGDQGKVAETQTSGSTGEPVRIKKTGITELFLHTYSLRIHQWADIPFNSRLTTIRANHREHRENKNWGPPFVFLYKTGPAQIIPITTPISRQVELLARFQPETLLIYPSNLQGLVALWLKDGFDLASLTTIRSMGETLTDDLKQNMLELKPDLKFVDAYSSEECGAIALQCPDGSGYHVMAESVIVEVLDDKDRPCQPGAIGRVVVTDLQNLASPVIRYEIGDYAQVGEPCGCGRGLPKLQRILGRQRNLVVKPNGERHWPLVGFRNFRDIAPIRQYQMIQESRQAITVHLAVDAPLTDVQKNELTTLIQEKLDYPFRIEIQDGLEDLPMQPNGKFEEFICKTD